MNDQEIGELFRTEDDPPPRAGYWEEIQARLEAVDAERARPRLTVVAPEPSVTGEKIPLRTDTDVTVLRQSTMNINEYPRNTQRTLFLAAAAVIVVGLLGLGLLLQSSGDDAVSEVASEGSAEQVDGDNNSSNPAETGGDDESAASTTTPTTEAPETTDETTATTGADDTETTAEAGATGPVNEAEDGIRFDYGVVERIEEVDGTVWIWFDRSGFGPDQLSGLDHQVEPRYELASDFHGGENVNPRLRTFPLADGAAILLLNPVIAEAVCAGDQTDAEEPFEAFTAATVLAEGWQERTVSLTFNDSGEVTIVRDQTGC